MCIIIHSKEGALPDRDKLETAWVNNPHGFGLMYVDEGRVVVDHTLPKTFSEVWNHLKFIEGTPWALHFRWVTRGKKSISQCHPFKIAAKEELGKDLYMMHNGTLTFLDDVVALTKGEKSDTKMFADILGKTVARLQDPDLLFGKSAQEYLYKEIGSWNKLLFLDSTGKFRYMNRFGGKEDSDFWFSNTYSFQKNYRLETLFESQYISQKTFRPVPQRPAVNVPINTPTSRANIPAATKVRRTGSVPIVSTKVVHPHRSDIFSPKKLKRTQGEILKTAPGIQPLPSSPNAYIFSKQWKPEGKNIATALAGFEEDDSDDIMFMEYMNDKP